MAGIFGAGRTSDSPSAEAGLTVILDLHHFDDLMSDPDAFAPVFVAIWSELADHFEGYDDRLIVELLNEPRSAVTTARSLELLGLKIKLRHRQPRG